MRRIIVRGLSAAALGFLVLWGLRLGYGYLEQPDGGYRQVSSTGNLGGFENEKRNYASSKVERVGPQVGQYVPIGAIDQKYERVADVRARAKDFDGEEAALRKLAGEHGGVIQLERRHGLRGDRALNLAIGVPPDHFDAFVAAVRAIGEVTHFTVDKQDRTNEWKALEAKRAVLESTRASLAALKARSGSIEELVALEERILDVHEEIQSLGISLGEFDAVNELCTVKVTLAEEVTARVAAGPTIPVWRRLRVAFEWAVPFYLRLLGVVLTAVLIALAGAVVAERLRPLQRALARAETVPPPGGADASR